MFLVKKYVSRLIFPLPLCCELLLLGLLLLWWGKRPRLSKGLITTGVILLLLFSNGPFSDLLLSPLETKYPALNDPAALNRERATPLRWVVVLGGGYSWEANLPATTRLEGDSLLRLSEGLRMHKALPGSKLLLSIGAHGAEVEQGVVSVAGTLGLDRSDLRIIQGAKDTAGEVGLFREAIGSEAFVLVTSASHMPRSVALFEAAGMNPLPAPTDYWIKERAGFDNWFPTTNSLLKSERAFYEYLGLAWMRLRG